MFEASPEELDKIVLWEEKDILLYQVSIPLDMGYPHQ